MVTEVGIRAVGRAVPSLRLDAREAAAAWGAPRPRGVETLSTPGFDEDAITLAVEAAKRALAAADENPAKVHFIALATTHLESDATVIAEALGARDARILETVGTTSLGLGAIAAAYDAVQATGKAALAIAADVPTAAPGSAEEATRGAGAVAFLVVPEGGVRMTHRAARARDHVRRDRVDAKGFTRGPDVAVDTGDELGEAAQTLPQDTYDFVASPNPVPGPEGKPLKARQALISPRGLVGDWGAADAAVHLAEALATASPGSRGVAVECRGGATLILSFHVNRKPAGAESIALEQGRGHPVPYLAAIQARGAFMDLAAMPEEPMGAYVPFPEYADMLDARYRLVGKKCLACSHLMYPPRATCTKCAARAFEDAPLSGRSTLDSFTRIGRGGAPSEFAAEQAMTGAYLVGLVRFDEGPALLARLADATEIDVEIGIELEPVLRRLYRQEGAWRYGLKFRPASG